MLKWVLQLRSHYSSFLFFCFTSKKSWSVKVKAKNIGFCWMDFFSSEKQKRHRQMATPTHRTISIWISIHSPLLSLALLFGSGWIGERLRGHFKYYKYEYYTPIPSFIACASSRLVQLFPLISFLHLFVCFRNIDTNSKWREEKNEREKMAHRKCYCTHVRIVNYHWLFAEQLQRN